MKSKGKSKMPLRGVRGPDWEMTRARTLLVFEEPLLVKGWGRKGDRRWTINAEGHVRSG